MQTNDYYLEHIVPSSYFRHYKGNVYEVVTLAINESDGLLMVVYKNWSNEVYVRPASEFLESVTWTTRTGPFSVDAKHTEALVGPRFSKISDREALKHYQEFEITRNEDAN